MQKPDIFHIQFCECGTSHLKSPGLLAVLLRNWLNGQSTFQRESRPTLAAPQSHATGVKQVTNEADPIVGSEVLTQQVGTCPVIAHPCECPRGPPQYLELTSPAPHQLGMWQVPLIPDLRCTDNAACLCFPCFSEESSG